MRHGSLFSGIGGFDIASEWIGWENVFHCEWNEFGQKVLKYYWPNAISYDDITKTDFSIHRGTIDILTGGFPCQPYSTAGKRLGKEDERHLWPEMLRAIREIQPRWVVGENVRGIINWNGGVVFEEVQADLEAEGYEVQPFILPAASVDTPNERYRTWFVAYSASVGRREDPERELVISRKLLQDGSWKESSDVVERFSKRWNVTNSGSTELQRSEQHRSIESEREIQRESGQFSRSICDQWRDFPTQSPICERDDGLSERLAGITFSRWRNESIKAMGNAIVPQVVLQIFKAIEAYESLLTGKVCAELIFSCLVSGIGLKLFRKPKNTMI